jgi:lysophospholipid acyltransferase (LPLAT)-like uncharacterized protein
MFRRYALPWIVLMTYRLWSWTWRIKCIESPGMIAARRRGDTLIYAHWHGDELCIVPLVGPYKIATMTSTSKDGQLIDFVIRHLGGATSRGSSTRGGIGALKGLVRLLRGGYSASMAVDGPKGPIHQVKPGVFELSRLAQKRIVPFGAAASNAFVFHKSWNKARLPKPFARVTVWFAEPWPVLGRDDSAKDPALLQRLGADIASACQQAAQHLTL